eukprot:763989-Hanusia_phi.AAC.1
MKGRPTSLRKRSGKEGSAAYQDGQKARGEKGGRAAYLRGQDVHMDRDRRPTAGTSGAQAGHARDSEEGGSARAGQGVLQRDEEESSEEAQLREHGGGGGGGGR